MPSDFLDRVAEGHLLCDGGYYLEFERRCLGSYASKIPMGVLDYPEGVLELHKEFARAGAEVLQAMVWGVRPMEREEELHTKAVELAREAAGPDRYVAGTLSPLRLSGSLQMGSHDRRRQDQCPGILRAPRRPADLGRRRPLHCRNLLFRG